MSVFDLNKYDFDLPDKLIANRPVGRRDESKLVVLDKSGNIKNWTRFGDIGNYLDDNCVLVVNDSRVFKARLVVIKKGEGLLTEMLVVKEISDGRWEVVCKRAKKVKIGDVYCFDDEGRTIEFRVVDRLQEGMRVIEVKMKRAEFLEVLARVGVVPLPPYITRQEGVDYESSYQTIYAAKEGSVAAPTAGLHFTDELMSDLQKKGVVVEKVTLHVGWGTFAPVRGEDLRDHVMHEEEMEVNTETVNRLNKYKKDGKRIIAVGTTATRWLETLANDVGYLSSDNGRMLTDLFVYPGYKFKFVDGLVTNFHLPKSTLLMLVSAFLGDDETGIVRLLKIYEKAKDKDFRFYSFGDAMMII